MKDTFHYLLIICLIIFNSCGSETNRTAKVDHNQTAQSEKLQEPNYNYTVEPPTDWTMYDTVIQGLNVRLLKSPGSLAEENLFVNIVIASMENRDIDDFTNRNIDYLQRNMEGIVLLEKGNIDITTINARWFTYTKEQNGIKRDMINYIIPVKGFAYMITCGTNSGGMLKYRLTFDTIAKSFKG